MARCRGSLSRAARGLVNHVGAVYGPLAGQMAASSHGEIPTPTATRTFTKAIHLGGQVL